jgi:hypothetical protein
MEDIGKLLKHPLVIVVAVFLAALAFYYIASPYENCVNRQISYEKESHPSWYKNPKSKRYRDNIYELTWKSTHRCASLHSW